ncbi:MAG: protein-L-isoaspartate(D-aspartate) O-methyltransferase [Magnetococcales bacterium]|nr:protein-L-isoaspartate(D-aspartate) O-methyltransferase [Magnetococcales bacterium]
MLPLTPRSTTPANRSLERMVREQLEGRGIRDARVLEVMRDLQRHLFVDEALAERSYSDATLPIGEGQTLSQPYTVARMTEALLLKGNEEVLEIGTGSGYQTAVLARLCSKVFTIERLESLADIARKRLRRLGVHNVVYRVGDGSRGWPEARLFERILVTAGSPEVPHHLAGSLAPGGVLVAPVGGRDQQTLVRLERTPQKIVEETLEPCRFVPLIGAHGW